MNNEKKWLTKFWGLVLTLMLLVSGCGANGSSKDGTAADDKAAAQEVPITVWGANDFFKGDESPGQKMVKEFNEKNKGKIRVEAKYMPGAEYSTAFQAASSSNELPDIFSTPQTLNIRSVVANGWALPYDGLVSDAWKKQFTGGAFVEGINVFDGKTYSWPLTGPQLGSILYYNKDVLQKAGLDPEKPPKTWDELQAQAKAVTEKGKGDVFGIVFGGGDTGENNGITKLVDSLAAGISPEQVDGFNYKTGTYAYDSKATLESFNFLQKLQSDGSILPSSLTLKNAEASILFGQGKAAFFILGRAQMWIIKRDSPDAKFGLAAVPTPTGSKPVYQYAVAIPNGYVINAKTKYPKEVGQFIEQGFASPLFYEKYLQSGVAITPIESINSNKSLYPYPEFNTFYQLHKDLLRLRPDPTVRNAQTSKVLVELGTLNQPKVKPGYAEILQSVLTGAQKDAPALLKAYNDKLNKGLDNAVEKVKAAGENVSRNDFTFPNWDPTKDYKDQDYKQLK